MDSNWVLIIFFSYRFFSNLIPLLWDRGCCAWGREQLSNMVFRKVQGFQQQENKETLSGPSGIGDKMGTFYEWTARAAPGEASPAHSWLLRVRWACPYNGISVPPGTPAGPPWWGAHSHPGPAHTHLQTAFSDSNKQINSQRKWQLKVRLLIRSATEKRVGQVASWGIHSRLPVWRDSRKNSPTKKILPEDCLQKLYLVVGVFLCIGFFKKSPCIGHWSGVNLLGRRELAEDGPTSSMEPSPRLEGVAPMVWPLSSLTLPCSLLICYRPYLPSLSWSMSY